MINNEAIFAVSLVGKVVSIKRGDDDWLFYKHVDQVCEDAHSGSGEWLVAVVGESGWFKLSQVKIVQS